MQKLLQVHKSKMSGEETCGEIVPRPFHCYHNLRGATQPPHSHQSPGNHRRNAAAVSANSLAAARRRTSAANLLSPGALGPNDAAPPPLRRPCKPLRRRRRRRLPPTKPSPVPAAAGLRTASRYGSVLQARAMRVETFSSLNLHLFFFF